jgi:hypothetical protein
MNNNKIIISKIIPNYKISSFEVFFLNSKIEIPFYEIYLYTQEVNPKLYKYLSKFKNNYKLMIVDLYEIQYDFLPLINKYVNTVIRYRIERDFHI